MSVSTIKCEWPYKFVYLNNVSLPDGVTQYGNCYYMRIGRMVQLHLNFKIESSTKKSFSIPNFIAIESDRPLNDSNFIASDGDVDGVAQPYALNHNGTLGFWNNKTGLTYLQGDATYITIA